MGASRSRAQEFALGLRDTLPLMMGSIAFGVIFGTMATAAGLSPWATMAMSLFVFSGSAQFIAVLLLGSTASLWVVCFATLVLNLRHLLYAATLVDEVRHLSQVWRFPPGSLPHRRDLRGDGAPLPAAAWRPQRALVLRRLLHRHVCELAVWTLVGITVGNEYPDIKNWGLQFAMVVSFIGIVMPLLNSRPYWAATIVAGVVSVAANPLPYKLGLMLGALAGIAVGLALDLKQRGLQPGAAESAS